MKMIRYLFLALFLPAAVWAQHTVPPAAGGGSGTVTNVSSANARATVANQTTTPVITIVSAPKADSAFVVDNNVYLRKADSTLYQTATQTAALKDTIGKGGSFQTISAADSLCLYIADQWGLTAIYVKTKLSDTSHVVLNLWRDRGGARVKLFSSNQTVTQGIDTKTPDQNTDVVLNDYYIVQIVSLTGAQADMLVQLSFKRVQR